MEREEDGGVVFGGQGGGLGLEGGEGVEGARGGGRGEGFYHIVEVGLHSVRQVISELDRGRENGGKTYFGSHFAAPVEVKLHTVFSGQQKSVPLQETAHSVSARFRSAGKGCRTAAGCVCCARRIACSGIAAAAAVMEGVLIARGFL